MWIQYYEDRTTIFAITRLLLFFVFMHSLITNMKTIGYWFSERKANQLKIAEYTRTYKAPDLQFVKIRTDFPLDDQGPFDIIFHKIFEYINEAEQGNLKAQGEVDLFKKYAEEHSEVIYIDPLERLLPMLSRINQNDNAAKCLDYPELRSRTFVPPYFFVPANSDAHSIREMMRVHGVTFPIVCKPELVHGCKLAHEMALVFHEGALKDIRTPAVIQSFVNHNAKLYKLFLVGESLHFCERPSVRNLQAAEIDTIYFHTHEVCKDWSTSELSKENPAFAATTLPAPDYELFKWVAKRCRETLRLNLLGVDLIYCYAQKKYAIIDINLFPGFEMMPAFYACFEHLCRQLLGLPTLRPEGVPSILDCRPLS